MNKFTITVASLPDRENLVAEIYFQTFQFAEISQEAKEFIIQFYPHPEKAFWEFDLSEIQEVIEKAKKRLIEVG